MFQDFCHFIALLATGPPEIRSISTFRKSLTCQIGSSSTKQKLLTVQFVILDKCFIWHLNQAV